MNKSLITFGLTLAVATGAFAASPNDYVELNGPTHGPAAEAHAAKSGQAGVDYTTTASFERSQAVASTETDYSLERFNR